MLKLFREQADLLFISYMFLLSKFIMACISPTALTCYRTTLITDIPGMTDIGSSRVFLKLLEAE